MPSAIIVKYLPARSRFAVAMCILLFTAGGVTRVRADAVRAWHGTITIPTYVLGPVDPNPSFPLINSNDVYPYTMLDDLSDKRLPKTYDALFLENQYLKVTVLPELGGMFIRFMTRFIIAKCCIETM